MGRGEVTSPVRKKHRLGFVSAGLAYSCLRHALGELRLDGEIPILKLGMTYPIDMVIVREFAAQVDEIYVIEEKRSPFRERNKSVHYPWVSEWRHGSIRKCVGQTISRRHGRNPGNFWLRCPILIQKLIPTSQTSPRHRRRICCKRSNPSQSKNRSGTFLT